ncbi:MAG TPA: hypothetical protein VFC78_19610 [Tepidisphaeraceae bacterium]|nr:hypothetical protein [Tepidisphaeraceae bacterium]
MAPITRSKREDTSRTSFPRRLIRHVQCPACGYEPPKHREIPIYCPKCHGGCWEHFVWKGRLRVTLDD